MKRVLVIGSPGAGKSTLARRLGAKTGLKVIHLDQLYWKPNWVESDKEEFKKALAKVLNEKSWIIDGNYSNTLEMRLAYADTVVYLDVPRLVCLFRVLKRVALSYGRTRPDMAEGCAEQFDREFLGFIWTYPTRSKPKVEKLLKTVESEKTVIKLKSNREVEVFLRIIARIR